MKIHKMIHSALYIRVNPDSRFEKDDLDDEYDYN